MPYSPTLSLASGFPLGAGVRAGLRLLALRSLAGMQAFPPVFSCVQPCTAHFACKAASFHTLGLTHRSSGSPAATAELSRWPMRILVRAETPDGEPLSQALVQLHSPLCNMDLEGECDSDGRVEFEVDVGHLEKVNWLVYCNGVRQGSFEIQDGDQINIG